VKIGAVFCAVNFPGRLSLMRTIKIRGLVHIAGWLFCLWGATVVVKGLFDLFWGEPEANFYSPRRWEFITQAQWLNWSGFEVMYGASCIGIACVLWKYAVFVPEQVTREEEHNENF
jgi:hypothetical protein